MSLRASEAVIYERYGFGIAGEYAEAAIDPARARPVARRGRGRHVPVAARQTRSYDACHDVYDRAAHRRPGVITRPDSCWERYYRDAVAETQAVATWSSTSTPTARSTASPTTTWRGTTTRRQGGKGEIHDVIGASPCRRARAVGIPVRHRPGPHWKADERPRRRRRPCRRSPTGGPIRSSSSTTSSGCDLIDVDAALSARTYNAADGDGDDRASTDPLSTANNGTWRVDRQPAPRRRLTTRDLIVDIATLVGRVPRRHRWHSLRARRLGRRPIHGKAIGDRRHAVRQPPAPVLRQLLLTHPPGPWFSPGARAGPVGSPGVHHAQLVRRDHGVDPAAARRASTACWRRAT